MKTIYIVCGTSGEYSDRTDWVVKAFASEARAKEFCALLQATIERIQSAIRDRAKTFAEERALEEEMKRLDPKIESFWYDTTYSVAPLELDGVM